MEGRTVLITGASRGIGAEIARAFAERGAHVIGTRTVFGGVSVKYFFDVVHKNFQVLLLSGLAIL